MILLYCKLGQLRKESMHIDTIELLSGSINDHDSAENKKDGTEKSELLACTREQTFGEWSNSQLTEFSSCRDYKTSNDAYENVLWIYLKLVLLFLPYSNVTVTFIMYGTWGYTPVNNPLSEICFLPGE